MNKILIISIFSIFSYTIKAQVLNVNLVIQEQNQWCWAAVSKCVLDYYGDSISQCKIAEYTRNVATWHNFGSQDCCQTPNGDCNYWNYNWGIAGSIQDILSHFGKIQNYGKADSLTFDKFSTEIKNKRPLIIRWAWTSGGGHFVVGYGISDNSVYYMNPWPGEGFKISLYDWVVSNSEHNWKGTNIMITDPVLTSISSVSKKEEIQIYPNPTSGIITIGINSKINDLTIEILSMSNKIIYKKYYQNPAPNFTVDLTDLTNGFYFILIRTKGFESINKLLINH